MGMGRSKRQALSFVVLDLDLVPMLQYTFQMEYDVDLSLGGGGSVSRIKLSDLPVFHRQVRVPLLASHFSLNRMSLNPLSWQVFPILQRARTMHDICASSMTENTCSHPLQLPS